MAVVNAIELKLCVIISSFEFERLTPLNTLDKTAETMTNNIIPPQQIVIHSAVVLLFGKLSVIGGCDCRFHWSSLVGVS